MSRIALAGPLLLALAAAAAASEPELPPFAEVFRHQASFTDERNLEIRWEIVEGFYLYRHRFGLRALDPAIEVGALKLPPGQPVEDEFFGPTEIYRKSVLMQAPLAWRGSPGARIAFELSAQGCADIGVCYPPQRILVELPSPREAGAGTLPLPAPGAGGLLPSPGGFAESLPLPPEEAFLSEAIASGPDRLLIRLTPAPGYYLYRDRTRMAVLEPGFRLGAPEWPEAKPHRDEHFGEVMVYFEPVEVPVPIARSDEGARRITLELTLQGCQDEGICYPPMERQIALSLPAGPGARLLGDTGEGSAAGGGAWLLALLGAFLGGLLLNLMPCVLPVLSLKALAVASSEPSEARGHALAYTAGVLASMSILGILILVLRASGEALGWGFQLQQPGVVAALALLMFALGLMLSGVFETGFGLAGLGSGLAARPGRSGDFFTGVLAVVVASPCTAPFMGAALALAVTAPIALALPIFLSLGLGLASPFLAIAYIPALARRLPRPGPWLEGFKRAMAFPMYAAAVWLAWVLARQAGADAVGLLLLAAVALAAALSWLAELRGRSAPLARGVAVLLLLIAAAAPLAMPRLQAGATPDRPESALWQPFSPERLAALRQQGKVVFVNMTADWCITCKANEKRVLEGESFRRTLAEVGGVYLRGDWTRMDPAITAFLEAHGAVGVPLYVVFPPGEGPGRKLPVLLTETIVREALLAARSAGR
ncbi:MAG: cytochrome c biogenesis protein [Lysobacterales bacterium]|nr:MAG: cytochrome c biogenesis protein [Xanthomonadales bacterium]